MTASGAHERPPGDEASLFAHAPISTDPRAVHLARLAAEMRRIIALMTDTDAPEATLAAAAEQANGIADALEAAPRGRTIWTFPAGEAAPPRRGILTNSFVTGVANPAAPPFHFWPEGDVVAGRGRFGIAYQGPPGHAHGGAVAAVLDELLGMTQNFAGEHGVTGTLTVRYRNPTPLDRDLELEAWVDRIEGKKLIAQGRITCGGTICAEAEGLFILVGAHRMRSLGQSGPPPG